MFTISESSDFKGLTELFFRSGLEVSPDEAPPAGLVKCWEITDDNSGKRAGGIKLEKRSHEFVIGAIAVEPSFQRHDLGTIMVQKAIEEVKSLDGKTIFLVAKVPEFFKTLGFISVDRNSVPEISKCLTCEQFNVDCFPEIMRLDL